MGGPVDKKYDGVVFQGAFAPEDGQDLNLMAIRQAAQAGEVAVQTGEVAGQIGVFDGAGAVPDLGEPAVQLVMEAFPGTVVVGSDGQLETYTCPGMEREELPGLTRDS